MGIFHGLPIVCQTSHLLCQFLIVGNDASPISQCTEVLAWIERKSSCVGLRHTFCTMCLTCILQYFQSMCLGNLQDTLHIASLSIEMHRNDASCVLRDECLNAIHIYQRILQIRLTKHRFQPCPRHRQNRSDECIRRYYHLISILPTQLFFPSHQNECQGIQSVTTTHTMLHTEIVSKLLFESLHLSVQQIPPTAHHTVHSLLQFRAKRLIHSLQIQKINLHISTFMNCYCKNRANETIMQLFPPLSLFHFFLPPS